MAYYLGLSNPKRIADAHRHCSKTPRKRSRPARSAARHSAMQVAAESLPWEPTWWSIRWYPGERDGEVQGKRRSTGNHGFYMVLYGSIWFYNELIKGFLNKKCCQNRFCHGRSRNCPLFVYGILKIPTLTNISVKTTDLKVGSFMGRYPEGM